MLGGRAELELGLTEEGAEEGKREKAADNKSKHICLLVITNRIF